MGNVAFMYRELAGAFLYGDFMQMSRAGRVIWNVVGGRKKVPAADTVFMMIAGGDRRKT